MEVAVRPREAMRAAAETPPPGHEGAFERLAVGRWQERVRVRIAVEDPHQTLAVPDQLADPPLVERGLVPLVGVALGEKAPERDGALDVEIAEGQSASSRSRSSQ